MIDEEGGEGDLLAAEAGVPSASPRRTKKGKKTADLAFAQHLLEHARYLSFIRRSGEAIPIIEHCLDLLKTSYYTYSSHQHGGWHQGAKSGLPDKEWSVANNFMARLLHERKDTNRALFHFNAALEADERAAKSLRANEHLMVAHTNVGAMKLSLGLRQRNDKRLLREAQKSFEKAMRAARASIRIGEFTTSSSKYLSFKKSYENTVRLAHARGALETCSAGVNRFLYGFTCSTPLDTEGS